MKKKILNEIVETVLGAIAICGAWGIILYVAYISY